MNTQSFSMAEAILSSLDSQTLILDVLGNVKFANRKTRCHFGCLDQMPEKMVGVNYFDYCDQATAKGNNNASFVKKNIKAVLNNEKPYFHWEYHFVEDGKSQWFSIKARQLEKDSKFVLLVHQNITDRKNTKVDLDILKEDLDSTNITELNVNDLILEKSKMLKASVQLAKLGTWQIDLLNELVILDNIAQKIFEFPLDQKSVPFAQFIQRFRKKDRAKLIVQFERSIVNGREWNGVFQINTETGIRWISTEVQSILNKEGSVTKFICVSQDITEREHVKEQLRASEEKAKILFDYSPILIWEENFSNVKKHLDELKRKGISDYKQYFKNNLDIVEELANSVEFIQMNQTSLDYYEVESKDELLINLADWFEDKSWDLFIDELVALAEGESTFEGEVPIITPKGESKKLYLRLAVPPQYMDTLEVVLVSFLDITELKKKEKLLKEKEHKIREYSTQLEQKVLKRTEDLTISQERLKMAQRMAQIGYWEWNIETNQLICSNEFYEIFEAEIGSFESLENVIDMIHLDDREQAIKVQVGILKGEIPEPFNFRIITAMGNLKNIYTSVDPPIRDADGTIIKLVGINQDVTRLKKFEDLQVQVEGVIQGQESERERLAGELHDSINPLLSLASLNVESVLENKEVKDVMVSKKLNNTIAVLQDAIEGIREISRNLSPAVLKNFGLAKGLEQLSNQVRGSSELKVNLHVHDMKKRIEFKIELQLFRITQELINNILKHAKATEIEIQLIKHPQSVLLMVSDNGTGFNYNKLNKKEDGYGLKSIQSRVESLFGKIDVDSASDMGTTTIIEIPL